MSVENNIPKHWQEKQLGEVFAIERGGSPRPIEDYITDNENGINWIKIGDTKDVVKYISKTKEKIKPEGAKRSRMVYEDDFLLSNSMSFGKPFIMKTSGCIHDGWLVIRKNEIIDNDYLYYILSSNSLYQQFSKLAKGSTVKNLNIDAVKQAIIKFPPLPEQQAIVSKIEELFSDLDNGIQQLQKAQQQLKIYRQSLLKAAFEGKLSLNHDSSENCLNHDSSDLSDEHDLKKKGDNQGNHINQKNQGSDILPEGWKWVKLGTVIDKIEAGKSFKCDERTPQLDEVGVIKVSAVTWQVFNEYQSKTVIEKDRINENYFIQKEDFLFSRANTLDLVGAVVIVNSIERKLMLSDKTLRFHFSPNVSKKFMLYYLRSKKGRNEIQRLSTGNQESMRNIGQERIKQIEFPFPPLSEQQLIVDELESKLTVCDKIEETISHSLQQAETLKQSILKKAFSGQLVNCSPGF